MRPAASSCSCVRADFFGSFDKKSEPARQYLEAAAASRLKFPVMRSPAFIHAAPAFAGSPARPKITFGSARSTILLLPPAERSIRTLPRQFLYDRFARPLAQIGDDALLAQRLARHASVAPVQDQPMMGMALIVRRDDLLEPLFDLERRLAGRQAGAIADAKNVGIDRDGRLAEGDIEHDIGGLAPDPRQFLQLLA